MLPKVILLRTNKETGFIDFFDGGKFSVDPYNCYVYDNYNEALVDRRMYKDNEHIYRIQHIQ